MKGNNPQQRLDKLYNHAERISIPSDEKLVFFSDIHLGNGGKRDDSLKNSGLLLSVLENYYLKKEHTLFLNGDIEELLKFSQNQIRKRWDDFYRIFHQFQEKGKLYKLLGNHDNNLIRDNSYEFPCYSSILLQYGGFELFVYHGHQSSFAYSHLGAMIEFFLHWFARPLNIKNISVAYNNRKKYKVEIESYEYARENRLISIIGHTHRPLFESLSHRDNLLYKLESSLRKYRKSSEKGQSRLRKKIHRLNKEIEHSNKNDPLEPLNSLYSGGFVQPCLFNSGCTIGKRGISCLEIEKGKISLVHWFDSERGSRYDKKKELTEDPENSRFKRVILKQDDLSYIQDCIDLLQ